MAGAFLLLWSIAWKLGKEGLVMNVKIERLELEMQKNNTKITRLQARNKEIAEQVMELENLGILGLVKEQKLTLKELAELFQEMKQNPVIPMEEEKEEVNHEEM